MKEIRKHTVEKMNELGALGKPFAFLIDFDFQKPLIFHPDDCSRLLWQTPSKANFIRKEVLTQKQPEWKPQPIDFKVYQQAFLEVQQHIHAGDTYLLNLTMPTQMVTNLSPEEIFHQSSAPYKIWLKNQFVCFSPEIFVRINEGTISSFPMKGTIDATVEHAEELLRSDVKEVAEHHTIVDLIRNDLSMVASDVRVERFMYLDRIKTNRGDLFQMSSQISGQLQENYPESIGTILSKMLPAG